MAQTEAEPAGDPSFAYMQGIALVAGLISADQFAPFGTLIEAMPDGAPSGAPAGAMTHALDLSGGRPRFYIMALEHRPLTVSRITRHTRATQVLAAVGGGEWLLAVAPPGEAAAPDPATIRAFRIPGNVAVLLARGTWHAGPYFEPASMSFFNLELEDTNVTDHDTCDLAATFGVSFALRGGA